MLSVLQSPQFATKNGLGDIHKTDRRLFADVVSHSETLNGVVNGVVTLSGNLKLRRRSGTLLCVNARDNGQTAYGDRREKYMYVTMGHHFISVSLRKIQVRNFNLG